ncbi:hypothetical protein [Polymorphospora sp. NPDC050346]|uniref:hypothetical protein n=1 Tax=Polymorphospora sp. NPDC050346 TaxID=3155780 RepID=UPI0033FF2B10
MRTAIRILAGLALAGMLTFGSAVAAQAAAPERPAPADTAVSALGYWQWWDTFTSVEAPSVARGACIATGEVGMVQGLWTNYDCRFNGYYTYDLYVYRP